MVIPPKKSPADEEFPYKKITSKQFSEYVAIAKKATSELSGTFLMKDIETIAAGYVVQEHAIKWLKGKGAPAEMNGTFFEKSQWDITLGEERIDVKANVVTYGRDFPMPGYRLMVREDQLGNKSVTYYIGGYYHKTRMISYLNGWISKQTFLELAEKHKVGERIDYGTEIVHDCRTVRINQLRRMKDIPFEVVFSEPLLVEQNEEKDDKDSSWMELWNMGVRQPGIALAAGIRPENPEAVDDWIKNRQGYPLDWLRKPSS